LAEDPSANDLIYLHKYFQIFSYFISQDIEISKKPGSSWQQHYYHVHPLAPDIAPGISVGTAYVFEVSLLLVKEGHCIRVRSASPFVSHLLCDSHSSPHRFYTLHPPW
jgi:hypothetical protein